MKRYIFILTVFAAIASSCNLDKAPYSEVAAAVYVKDASSVNNLVTGVYNGLYDVLYNEWAMTDLRSDNVRMRGTGSTSSDTKLIEQLDQNVVLTANAWVQDYWDASYVVINRANNVLENLGVVDDEVLHARFEGEARFLRAWMYFNLVRLWGPVFIVEKKTGADEARHMQRSPAETVWDFIEKDLEAVCMGAEALEKMIPKVPRGDFNSCPHYRCPTCGSSVKMYERDFVYPHCQWCGQKLDWR